VPFKFTGHIEKVTIDLKGSDRASTEGSEKAAKQAALAKALDN